MIGTARRWVYAMAAAPVVFGVLATVALIVLNEVANRALITDVAAHWMFLMWFGSFLFFPGIVCNTIGASLLGRKVRSGRVFALIGTGSTMVASALIVAGIFEEALGPPPPDYAPSMLAHLPVHGAAIVAVPYVMLIVGSVAAARAVWATRQVAP